MEQTGQTGQTGQYKTFLTEDSNAVYNAAAKDHAEGGPARRHKAKIAKGIKIKSKNDIVVYEKIMGTRINLVVNGEDYQMSIKSKKINGDYTNKAKPASGTRDWYQMEDIFTTKEIQDILKAGDKV